MSFRTNPQWLDAKARYVAPMADDENPESSFARCAVAAYEMWLIETGRELPADVTEAQALVAYGYVAGRPLSERTAS